MPVRRVDTSRSSPTPAPRLRLAAEADCRRLRVEVSDTRAERRPVATTATDPDSESGRGLLLVAALADDWGVTDRREGPGNTV
ncbi:ATP-binding protein [Streptomyces collinus]|uniref:ATP-binding protein n=1 Tax=Streptomyces collinus TaxID=42684 RepID=UPI00288343C7|nr:ATP-binding protein [Streptomyces collinus]WMX68044.1 ATP-binding protein [Streptomyces collinus]